MATELTCEGTSLKVASTTSWSKRNVGKYFKREAIARWQCHVFAIWKADLRGS